MSVKNSTQTRVHTMNKVPSSLAPVPTSGITVGDIYYILFRHKWRILICATLGLIAAAGYHKLNPAPYMSVAKLFIRYVVTENKAVTPGDEGRIKTPDQRGETLMKSEEEILISLDLS